MFAGDSQAAINQVVKILAEAFQEKYWTETNKLPIANAVRYLAQSAKDQFMQVCSVLTVESRQAIEAAFNYYS